MLRPFASRPGAVLALLLLAAPLSAQGLYWESTVSAGPLPGANQTKNYAMPKKFRIERDLVDNGEHLPIEYKVTIVRLDKEMIYMVNPAAKTYYEMSFADMEKIRKEATTAMNARLEEVRKQLKDLPPEQRAAVEKQIASNPLPKGAADPKVEVAKGADKRDLLGHACTKFTVKEDGKETMSVWSTPDFKEFAPLREDFIKLAELNPMISKGRGQAFENIEGFPLETEMDGTKTTVTKVEPRATPDAEFDVPQGFTKTKTPLERSGESRTSSSRR